MKKKLNISLILIMLITESCVTQFFPDITEDVSYLVVEGLVTDDPGTQTTVKISRSMPINPDLPSTTGPQSVSGYIVWITDNMNQSFTLHESWPGTYTSSLRGIPGRIYTLHFKADRWNGWESDGQTFQSLPMEMKPVPEIDSIYYEKKEMISSGIFTRKSDGCQIYVDTRDAANSCRYFRWDYDETWQILIPFSRAINPTCWITRNSNEINVKSTAGLSQSTISHFPLKFISNETDRLTVKYSILVRQLSLNENEFLYWEKLKAVTQNVGSLYDITPAEIPNNIFCPDDPSIKTLGYFSVSSMKSKRIFIRDYFRGQPNLYGDCVHDTIYGGNPVIPNLNNSVWILEQDLGPMANPQYTAITYTRGCADCTTRGTNVRPSYWK